MPSAAFNKFDQFVADLAHKVHNLGSDSLMVLLTNTAPNRADTVVDTTTTPCTVKSTSNAVEVAAGNGYTKGGNAAAFSALVGGRTIAAIAARTTIRGNPADATYAMCFDALRHAQRLRDEDDEWLLLQEAA